MIRLLIVDDSSIVRRILSRELSEFKEIEVVGTASDPYIARDMIMEFKPDVITLDIEMPRMDGLSFLSKLMKYYPMPVIIVSSLAPENSETALKALQLGAVDVIGKPGSTLSTPTDMNKLARAVISAASVKVKNIVKNIQEESKTKKYSYKSDSNKILAIGASTGGIQAIEEVLKQIDNTNLGIVIVQHLPKYFTASFAKRLNNTCRIEVREACDNDLLEPGVALVSPGDRHMTVQKNDNKYIVKLKDGPEIHYNRPSVDVLFYSIARNVGKDAIGLLLTGMGSDGAKGLLLMHEKGAFTMAQNEKSSVVFGMPNEAIKIGAVDEVVSLDNVNQVIADYLNKRNKKE